jgi:hypothetical protein
MRSTEVTGFGEKPVHGLLVKKRRCVWWSTPQPRYVVERSFPEGLAVPTTAAGAKICRQVVKTNAAEGVTWIHSYVNGDRT